MFGFKTFREANINNTRSSILDFIPVPLLLLDSLTHVNEHGVIIFVIWVGHVLLTEVFSVANKVWYLWNKGLEARLTVLTKTGFGKRVRDGDLSPNLWKGLQLILHPLLSLRSWLALLLEQIDGGTPTL